jgi:diacylglycerol kinase family enzyme
MYYYILDPNKIPQPKFEQLQVELQGLLAEFNIAGESGRITALRSMKDLVETAQQRGAKTLVACGTDDTFNLMLALLEGGDFTLGFVPFDEHSYLAQMLGLPDIATAVRTIAARRIEKIDLAVLSNNTYFVSYVEFGLNLDQLKEAGWWGGLQQLSAHGETITIRIDNAYTITSHSIGGLVTNSRAHSGADVHIANPTDGYLDLLLLDRLNLREALKYKKQISEGFLEEVPRSTLIKCRKVEFLEPRGIPVALAGRIVTKFPTSVEIIPHRLKVIVGRNRTF